MSGMDHPSVEAWIKQCWADEGGGHFRVRVECLIELANGARIGVSEPPEFMLAYLRGPERKAGELPVYYSIPAS